MRHHDDRFVVVALQSLEQRSKAGLDRHTTRVARLRGPRFAIVRQRAVHVQVARVEVHIRERQGGELTRSSPRVDAEGVRLPLSRACGMADRRALKIVNSNCRPWGDVIVAQHSAPARARYLRLLQEQGLVRPDFRPEQGKQVGSLDKPGGQRSKQGGCLTQTGRFRTTRSKRSRS